MRSLLKHWFRAIFLYPKHQIGVGNDHYEAYWEERGKTGLNLSPWQKERSDIACTYIDEQKDATFTVTDIGCGDGAVLAYLRNHYSNLKGIGIDFSDAVLRFAKEAGFETRAIDFSNPEALDIPETDYVILFETIEHIANSELLVSKAYASARKAVFISIPNTGFFTYRLRLLFGKFPAQWVDQPNEHLRFWTVTDMKWWLKALGLQKNATIKTYKGVPFLKHLWPSLFAAGVVVILKK